MIRLFSILMVVAAFSGFSEAYAADEGFRFKSTGDVKPESDQTLKFKDEADKSEDTANVTALQYPKNELGLAIDNFGFNFRDEILFKQIYTYAGSGTTPSGFGFSYLWDESLAEYRGFTARYYRLPIPPSLTLKGQNIRVADSAAEIYQVRFVDSLYCYLGDASFNKACVGYQVGLDSFAVMDYPFGGVNDELRLQSLKDIVGGVHLNFQHGFIGRSTWNLNLEGSFAPGFMQDANFGIKFAQRYKAALGTEWPVWGFFMNANAEAIYDNVEVKNGLPSNRVTNKHQTAVFNGRLGLRFEWGSAKAY